MNVIVMIPSYNPDEMLLSVVESIRSEGFTRFLIINDGSRTDCLNVFDKLEKSGCTVIHHAVNLGKGRALKTGFNYALKYMADAAGVVTCDADGQHDTSAIKAVAQTMLDNPDKIVLGVRKFFEAKVPFVNLFGNTATRLAFMLLTGLAYGDTQCGLRAFPMSTLPGMMAVVGERFEFENVMLLALREQGQGYIEVPMRAAYETVQHGKMSHFNKLLDPIRIYKKLLGFASVPMFCGILASVVFMIVVPYVSQAWFVPLAGLSALAGLLMLWLLSPARHPAASSVLAVGFSALCAGFMWLLNTVCGIPPIGAWWLAAIPVGPLAYALWLHARYGRKPRRIKKL
jgi:glycosyltransferase involved in cell wall biosynthesis